jgi:uncharacterized protein
MGAVNIEERMSQALVAHPGLGLAWVGGFLLAVAVCVGVLIALGVRWNKGSLAVDRVPALKLPLNDVLTLLLLLVWLMAFPVINGFFFVASIGGVIWLLRHHGIDLQAQWGLGRYPLWKLTGGAVILYLTAMGAVGPLSYLIDFAAQRLHWKITPQDAVELLLDEKSVPRVCWLVFAAVALAPVTEEILFRGFLHPYLKSRMSTRTAWILTAFIFGAIHFHALTFVQLFLFGLVLGAAYELTGSLPLCVGIHMCFNAATALWLLALRWWL